MHASILALLPLAAQAANIVLSNDDGWAEKNIRVFYDTLVAAGENVLISAPAENESGTGSSDANPTTVTNGCEFSSCPAGSPAIGKNSSEPRFNYVNSFPVTSVRYGIQNLSEQIFGGPPDIAVTGFNVGGMRLCYVSLTKVLPEATYLPFHSKHGTHDLDLRNRRCSHRSIPRRHPRHRLQRHFWLASSLDHRHPNLSNRLRRALHQRHANPPRLRSALPPRRYLAQRQLPDRLQHHLFLSRAIQVRPVAHQHGDHLHG